MTDSVGPSKRAIGVPTGRMFLIRRTLLNTAVATLSKLADRDASDLLPEFAYDGMSQRKVKIQIVVYEGEEA